MERDEKGDEGGRGGEGQRVPRHGGGDGGVWKASFAWLSEEQYYTLNDFGRFVKLRLAKINRMTELRNICEPMMPVTKFVYGIVHELPVRLISPRQLNIHDMINIPVPYRYLARYVTLTMTVTTTIIFDQTPMHGEPSNGS